MKSLKVILSVIFTSIMILSSNSVKSQKDTIFVADHIVDPYDSLKIKYIKCLGDTCQEFPDKGEMIISEPFEYTPNIVLKYVIYNESSYYVRFLTYEQHDSSLYNTDISYNIDIITGDTTSGNSQLKRDTLYTPETIDQYIDDHKAYWRYSGDDWIYLY